MRLLSFFLLFFLLLGFQLPKVDFTNTSYEVKLTSSLYAGSASQVSTLGQPIPSKDLQEKPSYLKIWKEKLNKLNPFHKKGDPDWVALLLAFFVGQWGAHRFYQGDKKTGFIMLGITATGFVLYFIGYILAFALAASGVSSLGFPIAAIALAALGMLCLITTGIWAFVDFIKILINM